MDFKKIKETISKKTNIPKANQENLLQTEAPFGDKDTYNTFSSTESLLNDEDLKKLNELKNNTFDVEGDEGFETKKIDRELEKEKLNLINKIKKQLKRKTKSEKNEDDRLEKKTLDSLSPESISSMSYNSLDYQQKEIPLLNKLSIKNQYFVTILLGVIGISILSGGLFKYLNSSQEQREAELNMLEVRSEIRKLPGIFRNATLGKEEAFNILSKDFIKLNENTNNLRNDNKKFLNYEKNEDLKRIENEFNKSYENVENYIEILNTEGEFLTNAQNYLKSVNNNVTYLTEQIDRLSIIYLQVGANQSEMTSLYFIRGALQSIGFNMTNILLSDKISQEAISALQKERYAIKNTLVEIFNGDKAKGINKIKNKSALNTYNKLINNWILFASKIDDIGQIAPKLQNIRNLNEKLAEDTVKIDKQIANLVKFSEENNYNSALIGKQLMTLGLVLLLLSILLIFILYTFEKENQALFEKMQSDKQQKAIIQLLGEIDPIQNGDLTVQATVNSEATGAIADSINTTVEALSTLVRKIKSSSLVIKARTKEVNIISNNMLEATEVQASEIQNSSTSIKSIAEAIRDISNKTQKAAEQSDNSKIVSEEGYVKVAESINSMNAINENMTETDRLMRKVEESSKQIFEITEVLSDITENTSILALNAAVQAAKAGEAGKGFKIVADSIQKLADSASDATRRVGALIAAVQTDIQAANDSVSKTRQEVSIGVSLSENAGDSLHKITEVSNKLSLVVKEISKEAILYAKQTDKISKDMEDLVEATNKTKISTTKAASSIEEIADLSESLGNSVQTFRV